MNLSYWADVIGLISFVLTILTLIATLNVRSQVLHSHERRNFKANSKHVVGKLSGYIKSLQEDQLITDSFCQDINLYMTDLLTSYTFFSFSIKLNCKQISYCIKHTTDRNELRNSLAKHLTKLKNLVSKEVEL